MSYRQALLGVALDTTKPPFCINFPAIAPNSRGCIKQILRVIQSLDFNKLVVIAPIKLFLPSRLFEVRLVQIRTTAGRDALERRTSLTLYRLNDALDRLLEEQRDIRPTYEKISTNVTRPNKRSVLTL